MSLIDARLSRLVQALVTGGSLDTLLEQITAEKERKKLLAAKLEAIAGADILNELNDRTLKAELHRRVSDVQAVLGRHTPQARQMLRKLLDGKILVEPLLEDRQKGFRLTGCLNVGRLLREDVYQALTRTELSQEERTSTAVVAPTGFEPVFQPCA